MSDSESKSKSPAATLSHLQGEYADVSQKYEGEFAGQSRLSRSLAQLDRLISRLDAAQRGAEEVAPKLSGAEGEQARELAAAAKESLSIYRREREAIAAAQEAGPDFEIAAELATFANQAFGRYYRHFAGKSRNTRDLGLLKELISELTGIREGMARLVARGRGNLVGSDLQLVEQTLTMYQNEVGEIERAQAAGSLDDRGNLLAGLANSQFQVYRLHFAGRARLGRRPQLLERVIASLRDLERRMASLRDEGLREEYNVKNQEIVRQNRERYENELSHIRLARGESKLEDLLGHLGGEANEIFEEYAKGFGGKDRATVDLSLLGDLCERLGEVARQMRDLLRAVSSEQGRKNLDIVLSQLAMFESEWDQVNQRQNPPAKAAAAKT